MWEMTAVFYTDSMSFGMGILGLAFLKPASPELHSAAKQNKTGTHPSAMPSETERKAKASASDYSNRSKNNWCLPVLSRLIEKE